VPRRRALCRARVASQVSCFGRGAVLVRVSGRARWRSRRTPAPSPDRVQPLLPVFAREPAWPVCRGSHRRRAVSGRAAAVVRVLCCEPAFVPWIFVAGAGECEGWPAAPARAMATPSPPVEANAGAPRRVARVTPSRGSRPSGHEFSLQGRGRGLPGPKRTPARAMVAATADAGVPAAPPPGAAST
jgi:hypothetical protein